MIVEISELLFQVADFNPFEFSKRKSELDIRAWIASPNYIVNSITSSSQFSLFIQDFDGLRIGITNDVNRFATAAIETLVGVREDPSIKSHTAWLAIRAYYAAFYSAHAILRLFGRSCTMLDREHASAIWANATTLASTGAVTGIDSGLFSLSIDPSTKMVSFSKLADSHGDTWAEFNRLLNHLKLGIKSTTGLSKTQLNAEMLIDRLSAVLRHKGNNRGNWLSLVRNQINYRFAFGGWFPFKRTKYNSQAISKDVLKWPLDESLILQSIPEDDIQKLFYCCIDLVRFCQFLVRAFSSKASSEPKQLTDGVFRLRNELSIA